MPTFFVASEAVAPPTVRITGPLLHHLRESLRLYPGEALTVTDDRGIRYRTQILEVTARQLIGRIIDTATAPVKTNPSVILAQASSTALLARTSVPRGDRSTHLVCKQQR